MLCVTNANPARCTDFRRVKQHPIANPYKTQWRSARGPYYLGVGTISDSLSLLVLSAPPRTREDKNNLPYGTRNIREEHLVGPPSSCSLHDRPLLEPRRPPLHRCLFRTTLHLRDRSISIGRRIERSITSDAGRAELRLPEERHIRPDGVVLRQAYS